MTIDSLMSAFDVAQRASLDAAKAHHALIRSSEPLRLKANAALTAFTNSPSPERAQTYIDAWSAVQEADEAISAAYRKVEAAQLARNEAFARFDAVRKLREAADTLCRFGMSPSEMLESHQ